MEVFWSNQAELDYLNNIDYLLDKWSKKDARNFVEKVENSIESIKSTPLTYEMYDKKDFPNVRFIRVTKQITLYYTFHNQRIELLRFWNNYQNPQNRSF